ncbi:MAG: metal-sensitive transcriptional regulator [bacterium]
MKQVTTHEEQLVALKRIEGQIKGIQRMIEEKRYCVDIITQLHSVIGAISRVEEKILENHLKGCVISAFKGESEEEKQKKIEEIIELIDTFRGR